MTLTTPLKSISDLQKPIENKEQSKDNIVDNLIMEEDKQKGKVEFSTYFAYIKHAGGCWFVFIALGVMCLF